MSRSRGFRPWHLALLCLVPTTAQAVPFVEPIGLVRQLHVAPAGVDRSPGGELAAPLRTISFALGEARKLGPGTEVIVHGGVYREGTLLIDWDGRPGAWNALRAWPGERPVIKGSRRWETVHIKGSYLLLEGFELDGGMVGSDAGDGTPIRSPADLDAWGLRHARCLPSGENCATGIHVGGTVERPVHHVIVRDNVVHDFTGGGIQTGPGDLLLIEDNVTFANAAYSLFGHSGISVFRSTAVVADAALPYRIVVRRNRSYANYQKVPSREIGSEVPTDGNGIIVDSSYDTAYPYRTLVENNIVHGNGGTGIHTYRSAHVDIVNNTSVRNGANPAQDGGEILSVDSTDVRFRYNIAIARPGRRLNTDWRNRDVTSAGNILFGTVAPALAGADDLIADPRLAAPDPDFERADFTPSADSPAVDSAHGRLAATEDIAAKPPLGTRDIGAVERR